MVHLSGPPTTGDVGALLEWLTELDPLYAMRIKGSTKRIQRFF